MFPMNGSGARVNICAITLQRPPCGVHGSRAQLHGFPIGANEQTESVHGEPNSTYGPR
jgi:hypothetical protein